MKKRKFNIEIYDKCDWFIELNGVEDFNDYPYLGENINYTFAKSRATKDKKIAYLFDIEVRDSDLKKAKDDVMFQEVCDFKIKKITADTETNTTLTGTFIEALEFIRKIIIKS